MRTILPSFRSPNMNIGICWLQTIIYSPKLQSEKQCTLSLSGISVFALKRFVSRTHFCWTESRQLLLFRNLAHRGMVGIRVTKGIDQRIIQSKNRMQKCLRIIYQCFSSERNRKLNKCINLFSISLYFLFRRIVRSLCVFLSLSQCTRIYQSSPIKGPLL